MPIKSKAQRRKFAVLLVDGKISPETFEEWNRAAGNSELPERLHPKKGKKPERRATRRTTAKRTSLSKRVTKTTTARAKTAKQRSRKRL